MTMELRSTGALGHARYRGRLREIAAMLGEIDDPVRQHAAAFAAERNHRDGDRPHCGDFGVHPAQAAARPRSMRRCSHPITVVRTFSFRRSQRVGLAMTLAR